MVSLFWFISKDKIFCANLFAWVVIFLLVILFFHKECKNLASQFNLKISFLFTTLLYFIIFFNSFKIMPLFGQTVVKAIKASPNSKLFSKLFMFWYRFWHIKLIVFLLVFNLFNANSKNADDCLIVFWLLGYILA